MLTLSITILRSVLLSIPKLVTLRVVKFSYLAYILGTRVIAISTISLVSSNFLLAIIYIYPKVFSILRL